MIPFFLWLNSKMWHDGWYTEGVTDLTYDDGNRVSGTKEHCLEVAKERHLKVVGHSVDDNMCFTTSDEFAHDARDRIMKGDVYATKPHVCNATEDLQNLFIANQGWWGPVTVHVNQVCTVMSSDAACELNGLCTRRSECPPHYAEDANGECKPDVWSYAGPNERMTAPASYYPVCGPSPVIEYMANTGNWQYIAAYNEAKILCTSSVTATHCIGNCALKCPPGFRLQDGMCV